MSDKISQKELKGPDQFQLTMFHVIEWARKHTREIAYVVVPILVIILGGLTWQYVQNSRSEARRNALALIDIDYHKELEAVEKQREELRKDLMKLDETKPADAKADAKKDDKKKADKDPAALAQRKVIEDKIKALQPDHQKSMEKYKAYANSNKDNPEGWVAGLRAASILLDMNKADEARPLLADIISRSTKSKLHQIQARLLAMAMNEDAGKFEDALKDAEALEAIAGDDLKPQVLLAKGRIQMLKKDSEAAKATFNQLVEKFGTSPEAQKARTIRAIM